METLAYVVVSVGISVAAVIVATRLAWLHPLPAVKVGALDVTAAAFWLLMSGLDLTSSNLSVKLFSIRCDSLELSQYPYAGLHWQC